MISSIQAAGATITDYAIRHPLRRPAGRAFSHRPACYAELRELTVENHCTGGGGIGILSNGADVRLSRLHVKVEDPAGSRRASRLGGDSLAGRGFGRGEPHLEQRIFDRHQHPGQQPASCRTSPSLPPAPPPAAIAGRGPKISNAVIDRLRGRGAEQPSRAPPIWKGISLQQHHRRDLRPQNPQQLQRRLGAAGANTQAYGIVIAGGVQLKPELRNTVVKGLESVTYAAGAWRSRGCPQGQWLDAGGLDPSLPQRVGQHLLRGEPVDLHQPARSERHLRQLLQRRVQSAERSLLTAAAGETDRREVQMSSRNRWLFFLGLLAGAAFLNPAAAAFGQQTAPASEEIPKVALSAESSLPAARWRGSTLCRPASLRAVTRGLPPRRSAAAVHPRQDPDRGGRRPVDPRPRAGRITGWSPFWASFASSAKSGRRRRPISAS